MKRLLALAAALALAPTPLQAAVIVNQPVDLNGIGITSQVFPDFPTFSSFVFDDFSTTQAYRVTNLRVFGVELGLPAANLNVTAEIWNGLPGLGGSLVMQGTGSQVGTDLLIDFGGQLLPAGNNYWLTGYVTRPFGTGGQWFLGASSPLTGQDRRFYNPGGGFGLGVLPVPGATLVGSAANSAFVLNGEPIPEPATLAVFGAVAAGAFGVRRRVKAKAAA